MTTDELLSMLRRGEPAPNFTLPAIDRDETVSLSDYRGRSAVLLGLFRGMYCPLCRRKIAQMGLLRQKLLDLGVDALAIVASKVEHARLYFRYHPTLVRLASDPEMTVLRAFNVPKPPVTLMPVILPPGRDRLTTKPCSTTSGTAMSTIGMVWVASLAARAAATLPVQTRMRSGRRETSFWASPTT